MYMPFTMSWDEVVAASDQEIVDAYMAGGMDRRQAEAYVAEIRRAEDPNNFVE